MHGKIWFMVLLMLHGLVSNSCKKENGSSEMPEVVLNNAPALVGEDVINSSVSLPVFLSGASDETVTLSYSTQDSTAEAGKNYTAVTSGTLTFSPGETSKTIIISILHDTVGKQDVYFKVKLADPVNAVLDNSELTVRIINVDFASLVWSDEFSDANLNTTWWNYEQGNNNGWGNNELEVYTNKTENVHLDSGYLHITALSPSANYYTSGRITTQGKKEFTYGRIVLRAKLPEGQGIWPALWMLGSNISTISWPGCGEIDIMEYLGHETNKVYGTVHWNDNGHQYIGSNMTLLTGTFHTSFHIFTLVWTPNRFIWYVDNLQYFEKERLTISKFPFDLPQFFIFNLAVGGNWPGPPDENTTFPQHMIVDYVQVYQ